MRGFLFYLLRPEPGPVGVNVDPLGEALGPRVFPDGLWVLFGEVTDAPAVPVVLPLDVAPVALPVAAEPAEVPPVPDADAPLKGRKRPVNDCQGGLVWFHKFLHVWFKVKRAGGHPTAGLHGEK